VALPF
jgi:hypothetical protein